MSSFVASSSPAFFRGAFKWYAVCYFVGIFLHAWQECRNERLKMSQRTLEEYVPLWFRQRKGVSEMRSEQCLSAWVFFMLYELEWKTNIFPDGIVIFCVCVSVWLSHRCWLGPGLPLVVLCWLAVFWVVLTFLPSDFRFVMPILAQCHGNPQWHVSPKPDSTLWKKIKDYQRWYSLSHPRTAWPCVACSLRDLKKWFTLMYHPKEVLKFCWEGLLDEFCHVWNSVERTKV